MEEKIITMAEFEGLFDMRRMYQTLIRMAACIEERDDSWEHSKKYDLVVVENDDQIRFDDFEKPTTYRIELNPVLCEMFRNMETMGAGRIKRQFRELMDI